MIKEYLQKAFNILNGVGVILLLSMPASHLAYASQLSDVDGGVAAGAEQTAESVVDELTDKQQKAYITDAWARLPIPPGNNSAIYMQINNPTNQQITIIGASAPVVANNVELHKSFVDERGISRMVAIDKIVVPAQTTIELAPGAIHIMLFDLKRRIVENAKFNVTLQVEGGDHIRSEVVVMNK